MLKTGRGGHFTVVQDFPHQQCCCYCCCCCYYCCHCYCCHCYWLLATGYCYSYYYDDNHYRYGLLLGSP